MKGLKENMDSLQQALVLLVSESATESIERLVSLLRDGFIDHTVSLNRLKQLLHTSDIQTSLLAAMLSAWQQVSPPLPSQALALVLGTTVSMYRYCISQNNEIDFVWTGPALGTRERLIATVPTIRSMIDEATKRILIVGYNLTLEAASTRTILDALTKASSRGCRITIALHDNKINHKILTESWPQDIPLPRLLLWCGSPEDPLASLHAKLISVDRYQVLITSANLTRHGMELNIEFGVRIRGRKVAQVEEHFVLLERQGFLVPI